MPRSASIFALIAANLVPLIGVLFYAWDANLVLALFWIENLIIGIFNLIKMVTASVHHRQFKDLGLCAFFVFHFGLFCSAHGVLLSSLLGFESIDTGRFFTPSEFGPFTIFLEGAAVFLSFIDHYGSLILLAIGALTLSHLVSFIENFILRAEIFETRAGKLMSKPYKQIIVMHAGLILGALAIDKLGSTLWLLFVIVIFKLTVDVKLHLQRRENAPEHLAEPD